VVHKMAKVPKSHTESLKKVIKEKPKPRGKVIVGKKKGK